MIAQRVMIARMLVLLGAAIFIGRIAQWTLFEGDRLGARALENFTSTTPLIPARGNIYDWQGRPLALTVTEYQLDLARYSQTPDEVRATVAEIERLLGRALPGVADRVIAQENKWTFVTAASGLTLREVTPLYERRGTISGMYIADRQRREYPLGPAAGHVVGYTSPIRKEEVAKAKARGWTSTYRPGRAGLEKFYNDVLSGEPGYEANEVDARGRRRRLLNQRPARPGADLFTTLDSELQQTAWELLEGKVGCIIAMDPRDGAIRALVSRPGFDPEAPGRKLQTGEGPSELNRAVMQHYPPGSPFKVATALALLKSGGSLDERHNCKGKVTLPEWPVRPFYCDNRFGHGVLGMAAALKYSCNVFFYEIAAHMGPKPILEEAAVLHMDRKSGIDLPGEVLGNIAALRQREEFGPGDIIIMGIGQGPLQVSPLQILRATAAIGMRGEFVRPYLGRLTQAPGEEVATLGPYPVETVDYPKAWIDAVKSGLDRAVNESGGTAFKAEVPRTWRLCGKTGTSERPPREPDAWFVGFAPRENPEMAVLVLVENAGHGGEVAAPIARDLIGAWLTLNSSGKAPTPAPPQPRIPAPDLATPVVATPTPDPDLPTPEPTGLPYTPTPATTPEVTDAATPTPDETTPAPTPVAATPPPAASLMPDDAALTPTLPQSTPEPDATATVAPTLSPSQQESPVMSPSSPTPLSASAQTAAATASAVSFAHGGVVRGPRDRKRLALIFTGGDFGEGAGEVLDTLKAANVKGAFFLTGDYLRSPVLAPSARRAIAEGHYVGPHSDKHLLYAPWEDRNKTIVSREEFTADLRANVVALEAMGAKFPEGARWWIPPFEWYNQEISEWSLAAGWRLFNFTSGTLSHTDYTTDDAKNYRSGDQIWKSIFDYEAAQPDGLNGFLLLTHVGAGDGRTDKFFRRLPALIAELRARGYEIVRIDDLLAGAPLTAPPVATNR